MDEHGHVTVDINYITTIISSEFAAKRKRGNLKRTFGQEERYSKEDHVVGHNQELFDLIRIE